MDCSSNGPSSKWPVAVDCEVPASTFGVSSGTIGSSGAGVSRELLSCSAGDSAGSAANPFKGTR